MINERLLPQPEQTAQAANTFASENFNTVLYTGNGSTQRIGGYINRGAVFNGSSSKIQSTSLGAQFAGNNTLSISFWFRSTRDAFQTLLGFSDTGDASTELALVIRGDISGDQLGIFNRNNGTYNIEANNTGTGSVIDGDWHHVVLTGNSSGHKLYFDGSELTGITYATGSSSTTLSMPSDINSFNIGANVDSSGAENFTGGTIDQVRIFDKALSSSEVTTLYGETHASTTISTTDIFNDNSGVALYQLDGNANDTGGVSGKFGSAAIFNGSSSYVAIDDNPDLRLTGDYSISFWFNANVVNALQRLINKDDASDFSAGYTVMLNTNATLTIGHNDGTNNQNWNPSNTFSANTWYHIVVTYSDTANIRTLYINGTSSATQATNTNAAGGTDKLFFGTYGSSSASGQYFNGKLDQVRIYSSALSSSDVTNLYNESSVPTTNLVAHYKFDGDARDEQQLYDGVASNVTYAYDGTASNVTYQEATKFSPDLVWTKRRDTTGNHLLYDSIRGAGFYVSSNLSNSQNGAAQLNTLASFDSNGFTVGTSGGSNASGATYAAWCFNAGTNAAASNTDGSITSTVKANTEAGFSIVSYTGNNGSSATIGHGLSSAPELVIIKARNFTAGWPTLAAPNGTIVYTRRLNDTGATDSGLGSVFFNSTAPTSTVFSVGNSDEVNDGYDYIAYCFHSVDGYQKVGSYTGATPSQPVVETGFQPAFVMIKRTDTSGYDWNIYDNKRDTTNPNEKYLEANTSAAEATGRGINFLSNGFQIYGTSQSVNASGGTYIYLAIAADPDETTPTVENSFDVVTYTGDGTTSHQIDVDFKPDMVFGKNRDTSGENWFLIDSIRDNGGRILYPNLSNAQTSSGYFTLNNDGFTIDTTNNNISGNNYVAFAFKAGDHDDSLPEINTEGTIDSVVSVNDAAGFSIVKYNKSSGSTATVGHGLSSAPEIIIVKTLDVADTWRVYVSSLGATKYINLNNANAAATASTVWNNTEPTSTVFSLGTDGSVGNGDMIAYCFTSITGYQKVGSYTGNGGTLSVTTGFAPRFVMIKRTDSSGDWVIYDNQRGGTKLLFPHLSNAEGTYTSTYNLTFNSNGFSISSGYAASGGTYIYLAIK
jgi:hypothetical protein